MNAPINIRKATINDVYLLQNIGTKTFDDTFGGTCTKEDMKEVLDKYFNTPQCEKELTDPNDYFFFANQQNIEKGYIRINQLHEYPFEELKKYTCIELVRLYVLKEYHGSEIASSLMNFAFEFARKKGCQKIYLSVWEYNFRARGFYEKMGFINSSIKHDFPLGTTSQTDYWFVKSL